MARPRGFRLNRSALLDLLEAKQLTMTEAAALSGLPLKTLSGLAQADSNASMKTVRVLTAGMTCRAETLFPELAGYEVREPIIEAAVAG